MQHLENNLLVQIIHNPHRILHPIRALLSIQDSQPSPSPRIRPAPGWRFTIERNISCTKCSFLQTAAIEAATGAPMNRLLLSTSLALALSGSVALAQQAQQSETPAPAAKHHAPNPQRETARLSKKLNLSADQSAKLEPILA